MKQAKPLIFLLVLPLLGCGSWEEVSSPHDVFQMAFGKQKMDLVWDLQALGWQGRDDASGYLKFKIAQEDLKTLFEDDFKAITLDYFTKNAATSHPKLPWWTPVADSPEILMNSTSFHKNISHGYCYYTYNSHSKTCYVSWGVMD